jgi:endonuclease/exonuclease/phosphatase (EEP) superfamily protein YafD
VTPASEPAPRQRSGRSAALAATLAALYPMALIVMSVVHAVAPQRSGPLAISQILAPHLFLLVVLLVPLAFVRRARALRIALLVAVAVFAVRFGAGAWSLPASREATATTITVVTWNLLVNGRDPAPDVARLRSTDASVIALQELSFPMARRIAADPEIAARFPHRVLEPRPGVLGMGILSAFPIVEAEHVEDPPAISARLELGVVGPLTIVNVHPLPGRIRAAAGLPIGFDPSERDAALRRIRTDLVDAPLGAGERLLLVGDFNVTDREPAYGEVSSGLVDAQRAVGSWPASTWRPSFAMTWPVGLLRIDYLFAAPGVHPVTAAPECHDSGSDHCLVRGVFELP